MPRGLPGARVGGETKTWSFFLTPDSPFGVRELADVIWGPNSTGNIRVCPGSPKPNLNHGQNTRANRTRHTTSSSTQSHAKQQHTNATHEPRHTSRSHAHTHKTLAPHSLSPPHARAHPPGEPSPARSPPNSPPAPPPAASPRPLLLHLPLPPHLVKLEAGEARELRLAVSVPRHLPYCDDAHAPSVGRDDVSDPLGKIAGSRNYTIAAMEN